MSDAPAATGALVRIVVADRTVTVPAGTSVAAALLGLGVGAFRVSIGGSPRAPLCGMGVCHECRVTIDGVPHRRACLVPVAEGMHVRTGTPGDA